MKNILLFILLISCSLDIGSYVEIPKLSDKNFSLLMTSAGQLTPCIDIVENKIAYQATVDSGNRINFLTTRDSLYSTPEGLKINMTYKEIKKLVANNSESYETGWGYIIPLKSKWNCMFLDDYILSKSKISDTCKVKAFFKRGK
jgi:hypothetical protein